MLEEIITNLYDELKKNMLEFESFKKKVNDIEDKNIVFVKFKESLNSYVNTILIDFFIFSDFLYQLIEATNISEVEYIIDDMRGKNGNI